MTFSGFDGIKVKIIEKIISDSYNNYSTMGCNDKLGYMEGIIDSLYSVASVSFDEDKKILNE